MCQADLMLSLDNSLALKHTLPVMSVSVSQQQLSTAPK